MITHAVFSFGRRYDEQSNLINCSPSQPEHMFV
nr:MAG TPA: envelope glycoprotein [Caudoviricetes sp.]